MSRLKLLAAAMLLALPIISACGDDVPPPPPTGSIDGLVSIEGQGQDGISVTLSNGATVTTTNGGMFRFDGVEAGAYTVTISNYPDDASFNQTSAAATIATDGENVTVNFPGTWIRTSAIMGTVTVENEGLGGVTVKLSGMSDSETITDGNGQFAFSGLRAGNYTVQISGFDDEDVAFGSTSSTAMVTVGESKVVTFEGTYLRASAITGQVTVEDNPLEGVMVSLQGKGEDRTATTNGAGQFTFSELRRGDYSVGITNPDADEYSFEVTSKTITIAHGETGTASFNGVLLRSATIIGTVTVENVGGIPATVTIQGGEKGQELTTTTNDAGQFRFTQLYAGDYSVGISGFDDDLYGFDVTTATITVERKTTATVKPFEGIELRTAGIEGTITVDGGHPLPGVTVTVTGGPRDEEHTRVTDDVGYYLVEELHAGVYTVAISDFDENEYEFEATTRTIDVGLRTTANVAFQGDLLRTAGISGRVSVEGMGLDGITVTLSGDADDEMMTADGGQYAFSGLAAGDYNVAIAGWDDVAYSFDMTSADLMVMQDSSEIQNFEGMHTRTASISGMLFLDEVDGDGMHSAGEPPLAMTAEMMAALAAAGIPGLPLVLEGPGVGDAPTPGFVKPDGSYAFENLTAGTYRVRVYMTDELAAAITGFGFRFSGELTGQLVNVAAAGKETVNFPFRITMQTIATGAVMGYDTIIGYPVAGVGLTMYPTVADADNDTNALGTATTDTTGAAVFHFLRADDLGPAGQGTDHLVFVKVTDTGHPDLVVADNAHIEIEYPAISRVHAGTVATAAKLLNARANFQWWIKSDANAKDGNMPLEGWNVVIGTNTIATDADGKGTFSGMVPLGATPHVVMVMADTTQADSLTMGEKWTQPALPLTYVHNPLALPALNTAEMNDLGPIYITWTTQTLVVGVHREMDDVYGYAKYESVVNGDHRPHAAVGADMRVMVMWEAGRNNRLEVYDEWDADCDEDPDDDPSEASKSVGSSGVVKFPCLPAGEEWTVRLNVGSNRKLVTDLQDVETFGNDLMEGMTVGSFGGASGAMPEVRLCTASIAVVPGYDSGTTDELCSTFGYQWTTGAISGTISHPDGGVSGLGVALEAVTTEHGQMDDDKTTGTGGRYSFPALQDGTYKVTASGNANYAIVGGRTHTKDVYHNEACWADPGPDNDACSEDEWTGPDADENYAYTNTETQNWSLSRLGLEIRGYVANVSHEENDVVRGDETYAGAMLRATRGANSYTAEVQADGSYKFTGLPQGSYKIRALNTANYEMLRTSPTDDSVSSATATHEYVDIDEQNPTLGLPYWDYLESEGTSAEGTLNDAVTVGTGANAVNLTFYNFAFLWSDGELNGSVREARDDRDNIAVEVRRCMRYEAAVDEDLTNNITASPEVCTEDFSFNPQSFDTPTSGAWQFQSLREGYYAVNVAATNYNRAKWYNGMIDDDALDCEGGGATASDPPSECDQDRTVRMVTDLRGKRAFNRDRLNFYVYNASLGRADEATSIAATGVTTNGVAAASLGTITLPDPQLETNDLTGTTTLSAVTYKSRQVTVSVGTPTGATYTVSGGGLTGPVAGGSRGVVVPLPHHVTGGTTNAGGTETARTSLITVKVTAENGYDDTEYMFNASVTNPIGNAVAAGDITITETGTGNNSGSPTVVATVENAFQWTSGLTTTSSVAVSMTMMLVPGTGTGNVPAECAQSIRVTNQDGTAVAVTSHANDTCPGRFTLSLAPSGQSMTYYIYMASEDNEEERYSLTLHTN
ncbi:MAG: hypothetical protein F4139_08855 [Gemmatimonadetes bacterium]|nr:hypothetical protein [Gemmatimonadota bacterium]